MKVLYTGFKGKNNSSCQLLSKITGEKVYLTNSFDGLERDITSISGTYDLVVMFGLDTSLDDMVRIERVAEYEDAEVTTKTDYGVICRQMEMHDIRYFVSETPTQYLCNAAYYHMLRKFDGRAVFIHIPSLKNMSKSMMEKLVSCMAEIENVYFCQI